MCVPCGSAPRERIDLRAVGLRFPLTRLEVRGEARERLPSCRDPASRDPRARRVSETCSVLLRACAPVRLLSVRASRQARLRTSFRLAPCVRREALRPPGDQDARCVQPTSATRTNVACTRTSCVPGRLRGLRRVLVAKSLGSARHDQGRERFTTLRPRFGGSGLQRIHRVSGISPGDHDQGPVRPEALRTGDRASDTPVAPLVASERPEPSLVGSRRCPCSHEPSRSEESREEPRPPGSRSRERARCVTTRGAFHRQGALPRIRWRSPLSRCSPRSHDLRGSFRIPQTAE